VRVRTARGYQDQVYRDKNCKAWQDETAGTPFPPPFMQCLIAHGRATGAKPDWEFVSAPRAPTP
jgi:hypothetical protein